jgi:glucose/mannose-6-phosphate isomerase
MFETMKNLIAAFPGDMERGILIASQFDTENTLPFSNIMISGLGGSGIGGTIVSELVSGESKYPIFVNNDYTLPQWVNEKTLFIACSYSGNTEETLAATMEAIDRGCIVVCISSGGQILDVAFENAFPFIQIPDGYPPRTALSFSICALFGVLYAYGVLTEKPWQDLADAAAFLKEQEATIQQKAEMLSKKYHNKIPAIYAAQGYAGVAVRWRQQINENAKMLCWHHILPEMNHNELVGWAGGSNQIGVVMLRTIDDHPRTSVRMDLCHELFAEKTEVVETVWADGDTRLKRVFYLINLGDWLSYYLAIARSVDPIEVKVIDYLKNELSQR